MQETNVTCEQPKVLHKVKIFYETSQWKQQSAFHMALILWKVSGTQDAHSKLLR